MAIRAFVLLGVGVLAGCSSAPQGPDYSEVCPAKQVHIAVENQQSLEHVEIGTRLLEVPDLQKPDKVVNLMGPGGVDSKRLVLFRTGVANCPLMSGTPNFEPLLIENDSTVIAMGNEDMRKYFDKGWTIAAPWHWQSYNFAYLPYR